MSWKVDKRYAHMLRIFKTEHGAEWDGSIPQLVEFTVKAIPFLPPYLQDDMRRYYVDGQSRQRDETTGRPTRESALFYQNIRVGRACLAFYVRLCHGNANTCLAMVKGN